MTMPNYGYKYRPWDKYAKRIITHQELYFNNPLMFNDIFDCQAYGTIGNLKPENYSRKDEKERVIRRTLVEMLYKLHSERSNDISKFGVSCFSTECDSILMWSHYAEYHHGICFKFDLDKISLNGGFADMQYVESKPHFDFADPNDDPLKWFFYKSTIWRYEQEIRGLVIPPQKTKSERYRKIHFPKDALEEVIFGVKFADKGNGKDFGEVLEVINLCQDNGLHNVKFYAMQQDPLSSEYKIEKALVPVKVHSY